MINKSRSKDIELLFRIDEKMRVFYGEHTHDINHYKKVWLYAKTIGELEDIDNRTQFILEAAAIVHDIACPYLRSIYGHSNGKLQESEGMPMAEEFLEEFDLDKDIKDRIVYLVGHHHTLDDINGGDYQILIEADYIVNAEEVPYTKENIKKMYDEVFVTKTGKKYLTNMYLK